MMAIGTWPEIVNGDTIKAADLHERLDMVEKFTNVGIDRMSKFDRGSSNTKAFLEPKHIYKPDLYGSPSPRMMSVSSQTHWRTADYGWNNGVYFSTGTIGERYVPIPGLCTRIKLQERARVHFIASYYAFELGGAAAAKSYWKYHYRDAGVGSFSEKDSADRHRDRYGYEYFTAANVCLMVNGQFRASTLRKIKAGRVWPANHRGKVRKTGHVLHPMIGRKQDSVVFSELFNPGIHDIGLALMPNQIARNFLKGDAQDYGNGDGYFQWAKHIYVLSRSMVCDVVYEDD